MQKIIFRRAKAKASSEKWPEQICSGSQELVSRKPVAPVITSYKLNVEGF